MNDWIQNSSVLNIFVTKRKKGKGGKCCSRSNVSKCPMLHLLAHTASTSSNCAAVGLCKTSHACICLPTQLLRHHIVQPQGCVKTSHACICLPTQLLHHHIVQPQDCVRTSHAAFACPRSFCVIKFWYSSALSLSLSLSLSFSLSLSLLLSLSFALALSIVKCYSNVEWEPAAFCAFWTDKLCVLVLYIFLWQVGSILNAIKKMNWEPAIFFAFSRKVIGISMPSHAR
jgi:hypothetical protein